MPDKEKKRGRQIQNLEYLKNEKSYEKKQTQALIKYRIKFNSSFLNINSKLKSLLV